MADARTQDEAATRARHTVQVYRGHVYRPDPDLLHGGVLPPPRARPAGSCPGEVLDGELAAAIAGLARPASNMPGLWEGLYGREDYATAIAAATNALDSGGHSPPGQSLRRPDQVALRPLAGCILAAATVAETALRSPSERQSRAKRPEPILSRAMGFGVLELVVRLFNKHVTPGSGSPLGSEPTATAAVMDGAFWEDIGAVHQALRAFAQYARRASMGDAQTHFVFGDGLERWCGAGEDWVCAEVARRGRLSCMTGQLAMRPRPSPPLLFRSPPLPQGFQQGKRLFRSSHRTGTPSEPPAGGTGRRQPARARAL